MATQKYYSTKRDYERKQKKRLPFQCIRKVVTKIFDKLEVTWDEPMQEGEPAVFVVNHAKAYGPLAMSTNFDVPMRPWVIYNVCYTKTFPAFSRQDFWHPKNFFTKGCVWIISYLLAPLASYIFSGMEAIPAYFDKRAVITIQKSMETLLEGKSVVIFPENRTPYSVYNEDFSQGFLYLGKRYYRKTKKCLKFYPVYVCKQQKTMQIGRPIAYDPSQSFNEYKLAMKDYLRDEMTHLASRRNCPPQYGLGEIKPH